LSQKSKALKSVGCEKNYAGRGTQYPKSGIEIESDAGQVSQLPASEAKAEAVNFSKKPLSNAGHYIPRGSSREISEKSTRHYTSQSLNLIAMNEGLAHAEQPLEIAAQTMESSVSEEQYEENDIAQLSASEAKSETAKEHLLADEHHHFSAIFVPQSSQPEILQAHLPQLVITASLANPELPVTRLVQLPKGAGARLSDALGLPRVSFIGILDGAPHSKPLVDLVRDFFPVVEIPWLEEAKKSVYLPLKINAIESFVPVVAKKEGKSA
jgi:RNase P subunit Pop3